jgi:SAM-dependent methyltransferase
VSGTVNGFDAIADQYDALFDVPLRSAYDRLAWEHVRSLLPASGGLVIDAGCGTGRWAGRITRRGHQVVGIDSSAAMARLARGRAVAGFSVVEEAIETVEMPAGSADVVLAMGSLQYTTEPEATVRRLAGWLRPNGALCVLVDSLVALAVELNRGGRREEAIDRLNTGRAVWSPDGQRIPHHVLTRTRLERAFRDAGLCRVTTQGLIVGATALGRDEFTARLDARGARQLDLERRLAAVPGLADLGKHLLVTGYAAAEPRP